MPATAWDTRQIDHAPRVAAPDGSTVRILCALPGASTALFTLPPAAVSRPVAHRTVAEVWYVVAGHGRIWRRLGDDEEIAALAPGVSLTIPTGAAFQFRNDGGEPLDILGATLPPWPGGDEAQPAAGTWSPTV